MMPDTPHPATMTRRGRFAAQEIFLSVSQSAQRNPVPVLVLGLGYEYLGLRGGCQAGCTSLVEQEQQCRYYHLGRREMGCRLKFSPLSFLLF